MPRHTRDLEETCRAVRLQRYDNLTVADLITLQRVGNPWACPPTEPVTWTETERARAIIAHWTAQPLPAPEPTTARR